VFNSYESVLLCKLDCTFASGVTRGLSQGDKA